MTIQQYIDNINSAFKRGNATEHTYRGDLKQLIESIVPDIAATNEPKRKSKLKGAEALISNSVSNRDFVINHTFNFPLFIYQETNAQQSINQTTEITPNLNLEIVNQIADKLGLTFVAEKHSPPLEGWSQTGAVINNAVHKTPRPNGTPLKEGNYSQDVNEQETFAPIDILDYIYAVLHSPAYREKYKEFLKIDFPRVPYPKDAITFWQLVKLGGEIRQIHLLESSEVEKYITQYPVDGNNIVGKIKFALSAPQHSPLSAALHSPPLEGCLQGGVVNKETTIAFNKEILTTINNQPIFRNFVDDLPYNPKLKPLLKEKRKAGILSEVLFWQQVHKGKFYSIDFDRQRIIGNYIVDFYVKTLGLVIEIDGSSHDNKQDYDNERQQFLESFGLKVYRITDADVKKNAELSMIELENYIVEQYGAGIVNKPPHPAGTPPKEGNFSPDLNKKKEGDFSQDVTKVDFSLGTQKGKVYINDTQYFDNVLEIAWNFYIGGYQPAQKWLKDRKDRKLEFDDILHYQKIIVALSETDRIMNLIKNIDIE